MTEGREGEWKEGDSMWRQGGKERHRLDHESSAGRTCGPCGGKLEMMISMTVILMI